MEACTRRKLGYMCGDATVALPHTSSAAVILAPIPKLNTNPITPEHLKALMAKVHVAGSLLDHLPPQPLSTCYCDRSASLT
jgi:hypothetical protein